ncbi:ATP-dependent DNA ligase [Paenibacillus agricola]|uniref:DNA ligase n=1 Tax=Paenibacillus agricola TaxID=2716264 RepID=A0ABX0J6B2_9BACL|nr:DNA ligase [Paenibacillus agricola]NHN31957.1 DNA ligase [Paenibacillus agricola]
MTIPLPQEPMAPIIADELPVGADWGYQLKWDGVRLLSRLENGRIDLFSRQMLDKTSLYPEAVQALQALEANAREYVLDGEAVMFDSSKQRPNFALILQRERSRSIKVGNRTENQFLYVLFDLLYWNGEDLRSLPYQERYRRLQQLLPEKLPNLFVTDMFTDRDSLWKWVEAAGWEGIVGKRLSSPYREAKKHKDWYKKKTALLFDVLIPGLIIRGGQVASLLMMKDATLFGRVSLGLDQPMKTRLLQEGLGQESGVPLFDKLPAELKREHILWLKAPYTCTVTGLEVTSAGQLRHPKIVNLKGFT